MEATICFDGQPVGMARAIITITKPVKSYGRNHKGHARRSEPRLDEKELALEFTELNQAALHAAYLAGMPINVKVNDAEVRAIPTMLTVLSPNEASMRFEIDAP
jgi:hypothetical protein